ncbi:MAG: PDZ domain-containing protein [Clostridia bacterium]|nr:PDZ domain-containing protein [Clostridia bacterium]
MEENAFSLKKLLKTIYRITGKNPHILADFYLKREVSIIYKWYSGKPVPTIEDLNLIVRFAVNDVTGSQKIKMQKEIKTIVESSNLERDYKEAILTKDKLEDFLLETLIVAVLPKAETFVESKDQEGECGKPESKIKQNENLDQKKGQFIFIIRNEILENIKNVDARLSFVKKDALLDDGFSQNFDKVRKSVVPKFAGVLKTGYDKLILRQNIASLRQIFNSLPLRLDLMNYFLDMETVTEFNIESVKDFYKALYNLKEAYEELLEWMNTYAYNTGENEEKEDLHSALVQCNIDILRTRSFIVFMKGLRIFNQFGLSHEYVDSILNTFSVLEPREMVATDEINKKEGRMWDEFERLQLVKAELVQRLKKLREHALDSYEEKLNNMLTIKPQDTWQEVVGKAISLRQFGRIEEAVTAFSSYGKMFGQSDPGALLYSSRAMDFTRAMERLSLEGGVYIYEVDENGEGAKKGLEIGDIIVGYKGVPVKNVLEYIQQDKKVTLNGEDEVVFLRKTGDGEFCRRTLHVNGGIKGIRVMPV